MKRIARGFIIFLIFVTIAAMTAWGTLAIYYSNLPGIETRKIAALVFVLFGAAMLDGTSYRQNGTGRSWYFSSSSYQSIPGGR